MAPAPGVIPTVKTVRKIFFLNVGFALKHEGYSIDDWDNWSRRDMARYHDGETEKKWENNVISSKKRFEVISDLLDWIPIFRLFDFFTQNIISIYNLIT